MIVIIKSINSTLNRKLWPNILFGVFQYFSYTMTYSLISNFPSQKLIENINRKNMLGCKTPKYSDISKIFFSKPTSNSSELCHGFLRQPRGILIKNGFEQMQHYLVANFVKMRLVLRFP